MPKGGLDGREKPVAALRRELGEEAGVSADEIISIKPLAPRFKFVAKSGRPRNLRTFLVEVKPSARGTLARNPFREHSRLQWVSESRALKMLSWTDARKLFEAVLNEVR